jgi:hypothetical protein
MYVCHQWDHSFHLYRVKPDENFVFDYDKTESLVRAKAIKEQCPWKSALCTPCFDPQKKVTEVSTRQIFHEQGWYASFAKISDSAVAAIWDTMNLPFSVNVAQLEHAFISNLKDAMVTAGIHANPMTSSMAIQVHISPHIYYSYLTQHIPKSVFM